MHNFVVLIFHIMKRFFHFFIAVVTLFSLVGCQEVLTSSSSDPTIGSAYEVLVVCDNNIWNGKLGKELRNVLQEPVEMINQNEPMFDIVQISPNNFNSVFPSHRNILKINCSPNIKKTTIGEEKDTALASQLILTFQGSSVEAMVEYLKQNYQALKDRLEVAERNRTINAAKSSGAGDVEGAIRRVFKIDMHVPSSYRMRNEDDKFIWVSNEFPRASQGFFIYSHPFNPQDSLSTKALLKARNSAAKRIPGPAEGSYMTTVSRVPNAENDGYIEFLPERKVVEINGRYWVELRGFWEVEGDFMGGPFVSYTTLNEQTNELLTIDNYIYSPKDKKRNLLRGLEHLVYGVTIPTKE